MGKSYKVWGYSGPPIPSHGGLYGIGFGPKVRVAISHDINTRSRGSRGKFSKVIPNYNFISPQSTRVDYDYPSWQQKSY